MYCIDIYYIYVGRGERERERERETERKKKMQRKVYIFVNIALLYFVALCALRSIANLLIVKYKFQRKRVI